MEESYRNEITNVSQSRGDQRLHESLQGRLRDILQRRLGTERTSYSVGNGTINYNVYSNVDITYKENKYVDLYGHKNIKKINSMIASNLII